MAEKLNFKVSYVKITENGLERHNNVMLNDISEEERKDIKSLIFLPINSDKVWDLTGVVKGFPILEYLYLPSTMTISMKEAVKDCPMLKSLLLLTTNNVGNSLTQNVVKVNAREEEGDNTSEFRTFVTTTKDGRQVFEVNAKQIQNRPIVVKVEKVELLTSAHVKDYISGEKGVSQVIDDINNQIEDARCKIDINAEVFESLLSTFLEKGVTFGEFTIDFSKLYDKIESYKTIMKTVNQVTIKEEIEGSIVEAYQNVLRVHYENLLKNFATTANKLCGAVNSEREEYLLNDLMTYIVNIILESPEFPADDYKDDGALNDLLDAIPSGVSMHLKSSKERNLTRKYLQQAVSKLKTDKELLLSKLEDRINAKISMEEARDTFAKEFGLDANSKQSKKLVDTFVYALINKNFGVLTTADISGIIGNIKNELRNGEVTGRALLELINNAVTNYPTENEIRGVVVDFIADNGYNAIKITNA